jgi:hypothetical protein
MIEAWDQFKREPRRYNMVEHNCSTVIAGLLEIGPSVPMESSRGIGSFWKRWSGPKSPR